MNIYDDNLIFIYIYIVKYSAQPSYLTYISPPTAIILCKFQVYNTVRLAMVTLLYNRFPDVSFTNETLCPYRKISPHLPQAPNTWYRYSISPF
jgi:hypothetical protein